MHYDVIIVGGGPAGATAALYARRAGLNALLLEKAHFPRDKICGDALGGRAVGILRELNLLAETERLPGAKVRSIIFGGTNHCEADIEICNERRPDLSGYVITRQVFDSFLFDQARRAGGDCREGWEVTGIVLENNAVCGVKAREVNTGAVREFRANVVLGADGYKSIISRCLDLYEVDSRHWITAIRSYYRGVTGLTDKIELHYLEGVLPGYFWIFPLNDGMANVGIGMITGAMKRKHVNLVQALDGAIGLAHFSHRFRGAARLTKPVGWQLPVGSKRRPCSGAGYMLLGDAAGLIDPFTGEGIANAMYSGRSAVEIARLACAEGDFSAASLARYESGIWNEVGGELKTSARLQRIARFQPLLNFTIRKAAANPGVRDVISAMIAEEMPRKALTSPLFYFNLLFK